MSAYPTARLQGKIIRMPSIATGNTPNLPANLRTVRVSFPTPPGPVNLGDLANVAIDVQKKQGVLVLPTTAIRTFGGRRFVQVAEPDGRHREVDIQVGIADDTNTEITQGLSPGDKVISPSLSRKREGGVGGVRGRMGPSTVTCRCQAPAYLTGWEIPSGRSTGGCFSSFFHCSFPTDICTPGAGVLSAG